MKKFRVNSLQLAETKRWIPTGSLLEPYGVATQISFDDNSFETKDEADEHFSKYYMSRGYTEA